jgi:hypothetical protein
MPPPGKLPRKDTGRLRKAASQLKRVNAASPEAGLAKAIKLLGQREHAQQWRYYMTPHGMAASLPYQGNVEFQSQVFVAELIFEKFRLSKRYRKIFWPAEDVFSNMAEYVAGKGEEVDTYDTLKNAYYQYKHQEHLPPAQVITLLYDRYRWQSQPWPARPTLRKDICHFLKKRQLDVSLKPHHPLLSEEERRMVAGLAEMAPRLSQRRRHRTHVRRETVKSSAA